MTGSTRLLHRPDTSFVLAAALAGLVAVEAVAFEGTPDPEALKAAPATVEDGAAYSPFVGRDYPDQVLFGDLHFHTETRTSIRSKTRSTTSG